MSSELASAVRRGGGRAGRAGRGRAVAGVRRGVDERAVARRGRRCDRSGCSGGRAVGLCTKMTIILKYNTVTN